MRELSIGKPVRTRVFLGMMFGTAVDDGDTIEDVSDEELLEFLPADVDMWTNRARADARRRFNRE